jgi:antitoxin component YwqK of YwqJK toxin-antitoxin module
MSIVVNLGDEIIFTVSVNEKSGYLYDQYIFSNCDSKTVVDLRMLLKGLPLSSISYYHYFLVHDTISQTVITNSEVMSDCLKIYHITKDDNFFNYLMVQFRKFWNTMTPLLYSNSISDDIKWDIYLQCPHQLIPKLYIDDRVFFKTWLTNNIDKNIIVNDNESYVYQNKDEYTVEVGYHNLHSHDIVWKTLLKTNDVYEQKQHVGNADSEKQYVDNPDGKNLDIKLENFYNGKIEGLITVLRLDENKSIEETGIIMNGKKFGPDVLYYDNGQQHQRLYYGKNGIIGLRIESEKDGGLLHQQLYTDDETNGHLITYYNSGRIYSTFPPNGTGESKVWYDNKNHTLKYIFKYHEYKKVGDIKYYRLNGDHAVIILDETEKYHTITMFDSDDIRTKLIVFGSPSVETIFGYDGNIFSENTYDPNLFYDIDKDTWQ